MLSDRFTCILKIDSYPQEEFAQKYRGLKFTKERFENFLDRELESVNNLSQIYMCGPTKLTNSLLIKLEERKLSFEKFTVI